MPLGANDRYDSTEIGAKNVIINALENMKKVTLKIITLPYTLKMKKKNRNLSKILVSSN